jgi:NADH dehydrogenase
MSGTPGMGDNHHEIVVAGAGYAGLRATLRLAAKLGDKHPEAKLTIIDKYDYHQVMTELPRVAGGQHPPSTVRIPLRRVLNKRVRFVQASITGFDFEKKQVLTDGENIPYTRLVMGLGSEPNDFGIPGLLANSFTLWSVDDARKIIAAVDSNMAAAVNEPDQAKKAKLMSAVVGGAGPTGVELAGELAVEMPRLARRYGLNPKLIHITLLDAMPTILPGQPQGLIDAGMRILDQLGVEVRLSAMIAKADENGYSIKDGSVISGGVYVWAGGVRAVPTVAKSGLAAVGGGRIKVDEYLRAADHPEIYVAGDAAAVINPKTERAYPGTAQLALNSGQSIADNLLAEIEGRPLTPYEHKDLGAVVSIGPRSGVADVAGRTLSGLLAHILKDGIEWEYQMSVKHMSGWSPVI